MGDIKTGLWQSTLDGSYINIKNVLETYVTYSDEGCAATHVMNKREIIGCYKLVEADELAPVVDDTFNDDTPVQTFGDVSNHLSSTPFGDIKWDKGTDEKCVKVAVCLTCDAKMPEGSEAFEAVNKGLSCMNCNTNTGKMRLIGIAGPARAGKDTLASYLLNNLSDDWSRSSFAGPIKAMIEVITGEVKDEDKDKVDPRFGVTVRYLYQTIGTDWGRDMVGGDIWVGAFSRLNAGAQLVVPDVRFENEAELVREHGVLIHLVGRGGIEGNHVSENAIEFKPGDIVIDNSRDMAWLHGQVDSNAVLSDFISEVSE